ncbi:MAG: hypothetical protein K0Q60_3194 [Microvirga sp.]|nr:hypothetical protein [Microvirga sp.]
MVRPSAFAVFRLMTNKLGCLLDWQLPRLRAAKYTVDIARSLPHAVGKVPAIRD